MKILIAILLIIQIQTLVGQGREIHGRILSSHDLKGLHGANIQTLDGAYFTKTNEEGRFTFTLPPTYDSLIIYFISYETSKIEVRPEAPIYEILWLDNQTIYETRRSLKGSRTQKYKKRERLIKEGLYKKAIQIKAFEK